MGKSVKLEKLSIPPGSDCDPGFEAAAFGGEVDRLGLRSDFVAFSALLGEVVAELGDDSPAQGSLVADVPRFQTPRVQTGDRAVA
jgi:hypothetical protein